MMRLLKWLGSLLVALLVVMLLVAFGSTSKQISVDPVSIDDVDVDGAARRLAGALQIETISHQDASQLDAAAFRRFHDYLEESFPLVHTTLQRETVANLSLLYRWEGRSNERPPVVLLSHIDVVPVVPGTEDRWEHPPYSGAIADGFIWGRGTLDDKFGVLAILEAIEMLLREGFQPEQTIYLAFGHDEEVGGNDGAAAIARLLDERGVQPSMVLDEGGAVIEGVVPYLAVPVAMIGIAEKGSVTLSLEVDAEGGHSSTPPRHTAIGVISRAVTRLEDNQMPRELRGAAREFFAYVGPEMPFPLNVAFANLWLLRRPIEDALEGNPATNATLRTTTAATIIAGGVKSNVLPTGARAVVNFRILPGDSVDSVEEHVRRVVDDPAIRIERLPTPREASAVSPVDSTAFSVLQRTIGAVFPDVVVAPYLTVGGTDSRHYLILTPNVYRFAPIVGTRDDLARIHGTNERISVANYARAVGFYRTLLRQLQSDSQA